MVGVQTRMKLDHASESPSEGIHGTTTVSWCVLKEKFREVQKPEWLLTHFHRAVLCRGRIHSPIFSSKGGEGVFDGSRLLKIVAWMWMHYHEL